MLWSDVLWTRGVFGVSRVVVWFVWCVTGLTNLELRHGEARSSFGGWRRGSCVFLDRGCG